MGIKKINLSKVSEARKKVLAGLTKMNDLVSMTLGPDGKSVIIERGAGEPLIVDDGRRVAENIKLDDPIEQMVVRAVYEVTKKTDEKAGDGTTTATVLTHGIGASVFADRLPIGGMGQGLASVSAIDREIQAGSEEVVAALKKMAKPIETEKELINVATVIAGDEKIGREIGSMYHKLGKNGHITLEFNLLSDEIESEIVPGMRINAGFAKSWMIVDKVRGRTMVDDIQVLVACRKDLNARDLDNIINEVSLGGKQRLLIIARRFTPQFMKEVYETAMNSKFVVFCVQFPGGTSDHYDDIAAWTGARAFHEHDNIAEVKLEDLGMIGRLDAGEEEAILIDGKGDKKVIEQRIKEVEKEAGSQKVHAFKQARLERLSMLSGGVGVIRIGAPTDEERNWLKYKVEDAKLATKVAYRDGVVPGGGLALKKISEALPEGHILKKGLLAPHQTLEKNAGGKQFFKVAKTVFDPAGVEIAAVMSACSAVSKIIRIGGGIAFRPHSAMEDLAKAFQLVASGKPIEDLVEEDDE
jgi:chaperonin GroEL